MIKVSAHLSKKIPIPARDFSSQQFGASLEIEVSDGDKPEAIQARLHQLYDLISATIDQQIASAASQVAPPILNTPSAAPIRSALSNPNGQLPLLSNVARGTRSVNATQAQQRALHAICNSMNIDLAALLAEYNVSDVRDLTVKDASKLIDELKSRQNGNGHHAR